MATQIPDYKDYHVTSMEISKEHGETMDALDDLLFKVRRIPGIDIVVSDAVHPILGGVRVTIRKELVDA